MKRIDIFLGKKCNNNCVFCCSKVDNYSENDLSTSQVASMLKEGYKNGAREVHFSGTEPTIRKDIIKLVLFSKKIGYERIKLTSNGRMFAYDKFAEKIVSAGLNNVIMSIHGHNADIHDSLTKVPGSFKQMMKGVENLKRYGIAIESNTAIVKGNYEYLENIAKLLVSLDLESSELIFVHPRGLAFQNYEDIVPKLIDIENPLIKALKIGNDNKKRIFSRYVPYCFLGNYVAYASENFEPEEIEQRGEGFVDKDSVKTRKDSVMKKSEVCKTCRYYNICMGVHKEHFDDDKYFRPIKGDIIETREELKRRIV